MAVYYKFKSAKDYDSIPIEGQFISVANLKERIFETKLFGKGTDFDLMISNAQTNEEYVDEGAMIPKNTSVLIRRVPGRPRKPILTERDEPKIVEDKVEELRPASSMLVGDSSTNKYPDEYEWDEFGNDLYAIPDVNQSQISIPVVDVPPVNNVDEESKLKALIDTPALDWNRQTQEPYGSGRGHGRGIGGRTMGRGFGRGMLERKTPPAGYVCHRCKVPGHFIQHCPTNGDPNYDIKRMRPPTGIPKSMLMATPDGSYALPSGAVAVLKPNEAAFEKEIEGLPTSRPVSDLPPELRCPLCKEVMKDAVLTSKCCFRSFCDKCIRDYIMSKLMCICGATNILADDLLPNKTLRETINRILESTTSSTENAGSLVNVQDMESAFPVQPKVPSPTLSAASKGQSKHPPMDQSSHTKDGEVASEIKTADNELNSLDKQAAVTANVSEATPESLSKGQKSPESAPVVTEDVQEKQPAGEQGKKKKKKKARVPATVADMQWRGYPDVGAENFGMPLAASGYNPYWGGGMPLGVDASYMAPFGAPIPFMGYPPGPFDVPFGGGMFPQDPFAAQAYMMPTVPRDLSELGMGSMGMPQGAPGISREEMEARKADIKRKREMDRLNERERSRDGEPRRESSSINDASMKPKPRPMSHPERSGRDRSEKSAGTDRHGPVREREPTRHSPPRPRKRKVADHEQTSEAAAAAEAAKADRKQKASVFSRISFPEPGEGKKRKGSSSSDVAPRNGLKEIPASHKSGSDGHRDEVKRTGRNSSGSARRGSRGHDYESSEEDYHFKRRPSSSSSRRETTADAEEEPATRPSRRSRERESQERGARDHGNDHGHERAASKRRRER
ncbi:E3 ubiquitin ligase PARAQUAT TOLERANCE 3-like [Curcuma longa]|uniref:E3 ubiquitin ligase PARAQUAT TOLERANCE 3-like n=1 Tax=Curcuma longa TaxID=136217 RepID=UPI003D9EAE8C